MPKTLDTIQHINLKIFVEDAAAIDVAEVVPVFHRWIRDSVCPEMLIDVAEYCGCRKSRSRYYASPQERIFEI